MAGKTDRMMDTALLVLRVGLALILLYYGLQKTFGLFGGKGFQGQLVAWELQRGIPRWLGVLAIVSEFAGSVGLLFGLFTRVAAFGILCTMATAAYFGANAPGALPGILGGQGQAASRVGYPAALAVMALTLVLTGAGSMSIDRKLFKRGK